MDPILSDDDIEEFRQIWQGEYGEELPVERARPVAERFLSAIHLIVTLNEGADRRDGTAEGTPE